jgi:CubicO group peptidase (beta-lactamase class C family)
MTPCPSPRRAFLLLAAAVSAGAAARPAVADERGERIDRIFAAYDRPDSPGCAVAVLHRGQVLHQRGYGRAHLEWDAPITPSTVFSVASVSKPFTALAVALLAEQGKLSLDDDVRTYLPELPDYGRVITLRHLLQHTSGLRDVWDVGGFAGWRPGDLVTDRDVLDLAVRQKALDFNPGDRHVYGNTGYTLAGIVVRRVSGQSLRAYADAHVFKPLGMKNSHFHDDHAEVVKNRASAYSLRSGRPVISAPTFDAVGSTGLFTTAEDLALWDQNFYDRRVGGKSALDQMLTPGKLNSGEAAVFGHDLGYGLGLVIGRYRGLKIVGHSGADGGYRAEFLQFPGQRFSVIVLGNLDTLQPYFLAREVADVCLAGEFPKGPVRGAKRADAKAGPVKVSDRELAAWSGTYWNPDTGASWTFSARDGKLWIGNRELTTLAADRFGIGDLPVELVFTPAEGGSPRKLTWVDVDSEVFEAVPGLTLTKARLGEYAGTYRSDELKTAFTLSVRDGELVARGWRDDYGPLRPVVADTFTLRPPGLPTAVVRFTRNGREELTGFTLSTERCKGVRFVKTAE